MVKIKKAIVLQSTIKLILAVVFIVVILYMLLAAGVLDAFREQTTALVCTMSSNGRGELISLIWRFTKTMATIISVFAIIAGLGGAGSAATATGIIQRVIAWRTTISFVSATAFARQALTLSGLAAVLYVILFIFPSIPLLCPSYTIDLGTPDKEVHYEDFYASASARTLDCYNMMGGGKYDPLWGLDPPNPKTCFVIEAYVDDDISAEMLYEYMS